MANAEDTQTTIYEAHENFRSGVWSKSPTLERAQVLSNLAGMVSVSMDEFACLESMQTGRPIREMKAQLGRLPEWLLVPFLVIVSQSYVTDFQRILCSGA